MPIIAIHGKIGSGKDTLAQLIIENSKLKWENIKFATKVKQITSLILNIPIEKLEDQEFKASQIPNGWNMTYRRFMQIFANDFRNNINTDIWCKSVLDTYNPKQDFWIISDLRFPNEYEYLKSVGADIYKIFRDKPNQDNHFSETSMDHFNDEMFTMVINNNNTLDNLKIKALDIIKLYER